MDDEPPSTSDASATTAETRFFTAATWNVNSVRARMGALTSFLKAEAPDVVCLQEIKVQKEAFPFSETAALGYSALICAQKAYNGVAVLSKQKAQIVRNVLPKAPDNGEQARFIDVVLPNGIRIVSVYVPNGEAPDSAAECVRYEAAVAAAGYADLQLLGIGVNGHIGFNEPDDALIADTHETALTESTLQANARFFDDPADVPTRALTMGVGTIMKARRIILLASGKGKHAAIKALLDDKVTTACPATLLKLHPNLLILCDEEAYNG